MGHISLVIATFVSLAAVSGQPDQRQREVSNALTALNNGIEAIGFSDACLNRSDLRALEPLNERIETARRRAAIAFPELAGNERTGDIDFICTKTARPTRVSRHAIRMTIAQLVSHVEAALDLARADVR